MCQRRVKEFVGIVKTGACVHCLIRGVVFPRSKLSDRFERRIACADWGKNLI